MKTSWSEKTIANKPREWINDKRKEFEAQFPGVRWTSYHSHGKIHFHPTWTNIQRNYDTKLETEIAEMIYATEMQFDGITFIQMYTTLSHSFTLKEILGTCKYMAMHPDPYATAIIGRTGEAMGLRRIKIHS